MYFSVIIATRNRPHLLARALNSVSAQTWHDFELLLIDDSAEPAIAQTNHQLLSATVAPATYLRTSSNERGRSAGRARNLGLSQANGEFVAFLDDDDEWVDPDYLSRAATALEELGADVHFADQVAVASSGEQLAGPIWIEDVGRAFAGDVGREGESRLVTVRDLLRSAGFAHLNTTIARRDLVWTKLGGFDPSLRYEEDRDLYTRLIDRAQRIAYTPTIVARHYVPAGADRESASTAMFAAEKRVDQLRSREQLLETVTNPLLLERLRRERAWVLKRMATDAAANGDHAAAFMHAAAALRGPFSVKWLGYTTWLGLRRAVSS